MKCGTSCLTITIRYSLLNYHLKIIVAAVYWCNTTTNEQKELEENRDVI